MEFSQQKLHLFHHDVGARLHDAFIGFPVPAVAFKSSSGLVERTIVTFARLDAFVASTGTYLLADGCEKVGCHLQKLYNGTFFMQLSVGFVQLTQKIGEII